MIRFLQRLAQVAGEHPDRIAVVDHDGMRETSYKELYDKLVENLKYFIFGGGNK